MSSEVMGIVLQKPKIKSITENFEDKRGPKNCTFKLHSFALKALMPKENSFNGVI